MKISRITAGFATAGALLLNLFSISSVGAVAQTESIHVNTDKKYIMADVGKDIPLSSILMEGNSDIQVTGDKAKWTPESGITVSNGNLCATKKGAHKVTVEIGTNTETLYVVAKQASDDEYVLYEENFDNMDDGTFPTDWTRAQGSTASKAAVENHEFVMDAKSSPDNPSRVVLPQYIGEFGDYQIEADLKILEANNTRRWVAPMYRIQNENGEFYPYYQMAVRKAASSTGVEFAEKNASNSWNVMKKASNSTDLDASTFYKFKVRVEGNRVQESINNITLIDTDQATSYQKGFVGFHADGCKVAMDNVRVTIPTKSMSALVDPIMDVYQPETDIAIAPSMITEIESQADLDTLTGELPATVILHINSELNVVSSDGTVVKSLKETLEFMGNKMMPAFYVDDKETINALATYLTSNGYYDLFVMSDKSELVTLARQKMPKVRGAVVFDKSATKMLDVMKTTNASHSRIAILPQSIATKSNIEYLQHRLLTVWVKTEDGITSKSDIVSVITDGANGIISDTYKSYYEAFKLFKGSNSQVRKTFIIGHRGEPSSAPENTLISAIHAYESGADAIENDIYLSKDGHIVIMHDSIVDTTTDGNGNIEDMTLEEIKALNHKQLADKYPNTKVPTLEEFFKYFKGKDVTHVIEIKSTKPEIVDKLKELIDEYGVEDQCVVISFVGSQLKRVHEIIPTMSLGLLANDTFGEKTPIKTRIDNTLGEVTAYNSTINPGHYGLDKDYLRAVKDRGVTVWPWTLNSKSYLGYFLCMGSYGLTTNYASYATDWADSIKPLSEKYVIKDSEVSQIKALIGTYGGKTKEEAVSVAYVEGDDILNVKGTEITATKPGTVTVMLKYSQNVGKRDYILYSKPVTLEVVKNNSPTTQPTGSETTDNQTDTSKTDVSQTTSTNHKTTAANPKTGSHGFPIAMTVLATGGLITLFASRRKFNKTK